MAKIKRTERSNLSACFTNNYNTNNHSCLLWWKSNLFPSLYVACCFTTVGIIVTTATAPQSQDIFLNNAVDYQNMTTIFHAIFIIGNAILLAEWALNICLVPDRGHTVMRALALSIDIAAAAGPSETRLIGLNPARCLPFTCHHAVPSPTLELSWRRRCSAAIDHQSRTNGQFNFQHQWRHGRKTGKTIASPLIFSLSISLQIFDTKFRAENPTFWEIWRHKLRV